MSLAFESTFWHCYDFLDVLANSNDPYIGIVERSIVSVATNFSGSARELDIKVAYDSPWPRPTSIRSLGRLRYSEINRTTF